MSTLNVRGFEINSPLNMGADGTYVGTKLPGDRVLFAAIKVDEDAQNPLENMDGYGAIYSFSRRHVNQIDEAGVEALREEHGDDVVFLSYFEHSMCRWFVRESPIPAGVEFQWDGVRTAGVWVPDKSLQDEVKGLDATERRAKMVEYATQACAIYTDWVNGNCYGYDVEIYNAVTDDEGETETDYDAYYPSAKPLFNDSCWGYYGDDINYGITEGLDGAIAHVERLNKEAAEA